MNNHFRISVWLALTSSACLGGGAALGLDQPCTTNGDCDPSLACHLGECAKLCDLDADCPGDRACEEQVCKVVPNPDCRNDDECNTPGVCDQPGSTGQCVAGRCDYPSNTVDPCDGCVNDSTRPCYTGPTDTENEGSCHGGLETCTAQEWGSCEGEVVPVSAEGCDDTDDDCDGDVDEDYKGGGAIFDGGPYPNDAGKVHGSPCGTGACAGGSVGCNATGDGLSCSTLDLATTELCDGLDNDCDGQFDEDFGPGGTTVYDGGPYAADAGLALGDPCGTGDCTGGEVVCAAGLTSLTCDSLDNISPDLCDTVDNDCDGDLDEDFVSGSCDSGEPGTCAAGSSGCGPAGLTCTPDLAPQPDDVPCNTLDDDCDGETDEGSFGTSPACPAPNCAAILAAWDAPDGVYHIDTPSASATCAGAASRPLYCDMSGGGWTLVMWKDGGDCQSIGPSSVWGTRWFLADCESWNLASELQFDPVARADTSWTGNWGVTTWIDVRTMTWSELRIAGYHDPDSFGGSAAVIVSSSNAIARSELLTPFGSDGYYLADSNPDGYYWCGGSEFFNCKGTTNLEGGWDFSTEDLPNRWLTIDSDTSGEPNCPDQSVSTCQSAGGAASCWSPDIDGGHGGQAVWVR